MRTAPEIGRCDPPQRYAIFGLNMCSEVPLTDRPAAVPTPLVAIDVDIRFETLSRLSTSIVPSALRVDGDDAQIDIEHIARYRVRGGRTIGVDPAPGVSLRALRVYLLGAVCGILFHQRQLLPLHASAIVVDGRAVLFAGARGVGKSTLAAYFDARGYAVLADDVCVLSRADAGGLVAWPDLRRLKLRPDAIERLGYDRPGLERRIEDANKCYVPPVSFLPGGGFPLSRVYMLHDAPAESTTAVARLNGVAAIEAVASNTYAAAYLAHTGLSGRHLGHWTRVARDVPIFSARRRRGYDVFGDQAARLERHFTQPTPGDAFSS